MTKFASLVLYETNREAYQAGHFESGFTRTRQFHEAVGLPVSDSPRMPTVSERILRAKLLMEEVVETITKGLGLDIIATEDIRKGEPIAHSQPGWEFSCLGFEHTEGVFYDPVETLDGLADVKVIANGTAVQFGLPMEAADFEVFCSNMTKLDENGKPIHNVCDIFECSGYETDCGINTHLRDRTQPAGKVLKPATYTPANIKGLL